VLITDATLTGTEFIHDLSARVTIVSRVSFLPFSVGILVRRAVTRITGDIRICKGSC